MNRAVGQAIVQPGKTSGGTRDLGWEILDRIRHRWTRTRDEGVPDPVRPGETVAWHPLSWEAGDLGLALLYASADFVAPGDGWDLVADVHVRAAIHAYRTLPSLGVGLFSGTAGVAWTLQSLAHGGERYQRAIDGVEAVLVERGRRALDDCRGQDTLSTDAYDMVNGLAGLGWYLLHTGANGLVAGSSSPIDVRGERGRLLREVLAELGSRARTMTTSGGGLATGPHQVTRVERAHFPHLRGGYINLGQAHGIAGVLALLGRAEAAGHPGLTEGIDALRAVLVDSLRDTPVGRDTRYYLTPGRGEQEGLTRSAWCYGNPGLAVALAGTGVLADAATAVQLHLSTLRRSGQEMDIDNPSLCHGHGGLAMVSRFLGLPVDQHVRDVMQFSAPEACFGLRVEHLRGHVVDSPGLLEGSGGVAAMLVAADLPVEMPTPLDLLFTGRRSCD